MSTATRIFNVIAGILILFLSFLLIVVPEQGLPLIILTISITLIVYGFRKLFYYFTMARHMVGGRKSLYLGVLALDFGLFTATLMNIPVTFIAIYLLGVHAFTGGINILRGLESMKLKAPSWKTSVFSGAVNIIIVVLCIIFIGSPTMITYIYSAGLIYSGLVRIITAFRRTAIVYIQ